MRIDFSFDDGDPQDERIAEILCRAGFRGTFYLTSPAVKQLGGMYEKILNKGHLVGGHTVSHPPDIKTLSDEELCYEVLQNKLDIIKELSFTPTSFCYPRGRHNPHVVDVVRAAGYLHGRTTLVGLTSIDDIKDRMLTPTTVHISNFRKEYKGLRFYEYAIKKFEEAYHMGNKGFFSVWGHAYEIEAQGLWGEFEALLDYMEGRLSTIKMVQKPQKVL